MIEPNQPTANTVIEDRKRAPTATLTYAQFETQNRPHKLSGLAKDVETLIETSTAMAAVAIVQLLVRRLATA